MITKTWSTFWSATQIEQFYREQRGRWTYVPEQQSTSGPVTIDLTDNKKEFSQAEVTISPEHSPPSKFLIAVWMPKAEAEARISGQSRPPATEPAAAPS